MSDAAQDGYCGKNPKGIKMDCLFKPAVPFRDFSPPALILQKNPQASPTSPTFIFFSIYYCGEIFIQIRSGLSLFRFILVRRTWNWKEKDMGFEKIKVANPIVEMDG